MAGTRRHGRELALQALYQMDVAGAERQAPTDVWRHFDEPTGAVGDAAHVFAAELVSGVLAARERIDALIAAGAEHWRLDRLSQVDRNILRIGAYELLSRYDVPASVAIDEAIEIAKRFGSDDSATFVNGVLDHIAAEVGAKEERP